MGFFAAFILIAVLGIYSHYFYHKFGLPKHHLAWIFYYSVIIVGGLMLMGILFYVGVFDNNLISVFNQIPWVDIENGKDYMWNSFQLLGIDWGIDYSGTGLGAMAFLLFLSYPSWYMAFKLISKYIFGGNKVYQEGLWYVFAPTKKPKKEEKRAKVPGES
jgi:hypothetical protein